jgi:hypothetical protein
MQSLGAKKEFPKILSPVFNIGIFIHFFLKLREPYIKTGIQ